MTVPHRPNGLARVREAMRQAGDPRADSPGLNPAPRPIHVGPASPPAPTTTVRAPRTPELLEEWARLARQRGAELEAYACDLERQARAMRAAGGR